MNGFLRILFGSVVVVTLFLSLMKDCKADEGDVWLNMSLRSYHFDRTKKHNENNLGAGITYQIKSNTGLQIGHYYNSTYHGSTYAGVEQKVLRWSDGWNVGVMFGFVNGYALQNRALFNPYLLVTLGYEAKWWGIDVGTTTQVVAMAIKVKFQ